MVMVQRCWKLVCLLNGVCGTGKDDERSYEYVRNVVWHPFLKKNIELLESVQHRDTTMVPGLKHLCYVDRLKAMDLQSLMYRKLRGDAIETYKYLHGVYQIDSSFLPLNSTRLTLES